MNIEKAIENIKQVLNRGGLWDNERVGLQLGIEALERLKEVRESELRSSLILLATARLPSEGENRA